MTKVSVILPVYNVASYLEISLNSLINQSLSDIEIICVNDCSTDDSLDILNKYATDDLRLKIVNLKENSGQGFARNIGIGIASGEYLAFVDPDDWAELDMLERLYNIAKKNDCDLVESGHWVVNEIRNYKKAYKNKKINLPNNKVFTHSDLNKNYPFCPVMAPWNKLYKTDFIKKFNICFNSSRYAEDQIFCIKSRLLASNICYCQDKLYNYRIRSGSSMNTFNKDVLNRPYQINEIKEFLVNYNFYNDYKDSFIKYAGKILASCYNRLLDDWISEYEQLISENLDPEIRDKITSIRKNNETSLLKQIFSVKNIIESDTKYKVITFLGFSYKKKY